MDEKCTHSGMKIMMMNSLMIINNNDDSFTTMDSNDDDLSYDNDNELCYLAGTVNHLYFTRLHSHD